MKSNTTIRQLPSPASPSLIARINELATLHGKCSREWGESGATAQRDQHAGMSNLCLEILDWIERNPSPTPTEATKVEPVDLQRLANDTARNIATQHLGWTVNPDFFEPKIASHFLTALQQVAASKDAEIERFKQDVARSIRISADTNDACEKADTFYKNALERIARLHGITTPLQLIGMARDNNENFVDILCRHIETHLTAANQKIEELKAEHEADLIYLGNAVQQIAKLKSALAAKGEK